MNRTVSERLTELAQKLNSDEAATKLAVAALVGDDKLAQAIANPGEDVKQPKALASGSSVGVWLRSIAVEGFRGIGERSELVIAPGPGLTLIVGRNGSGKSSFAEGLEALLTGANQRWHGRPLVWAEGWKNLHHSERVEVTAEFSREGDDQPCEVTRTWGKTFDSSETNVLLSGAEAKFDWLGWDEALETYKPFLSYNELGSMLEQKPSEIYDSLAGVLGLEQLTQARKRLRDARLEAEKPGKDLKKKTERLVRLLEGTEDDRAAQCLDLVRKRGLNVKDLRLLAVADDAQDTTHLRALASLKAPDAQRCAEAADELRSAAQAMELVSGTDAAAAAATAELLSAAVQHFDLHGDGPCPVCETGQLNGSWSAEATDKVSELKRQSTEIAEAEQALTLARRSAHTELIAVPTALMIDTGTSEVKVTEVRERWESWRTLGDDIPTPDELADRLVRATEVTQAADAIRDEAKRKLEVLNDVWRPTAAAVLTWAADAEAAETSTTRAKQLKNAEDLLKAGEEELRQERFEPIAAQAAELWAGLRQQSNVNLESVTLEGQATRRRVDLNVTVDGTETSALGVMSQGELHALALALFLPRVTSVDSPFRFVLIDDPVQAMDPARVDGLAKVLAGVAKSRQVLVFTHDDRLPSACRRLDVEANVYAVDRRPNSKVNTQWTDRPSVNALRDAESIARSSSIPPDLRQRIVPIHCRRAVEAAIRDELWHKLLGGGSTHDEVDRKIAGAAMTKELLALLLDCHHSEAQTRLDDVEYGLGGKFGFLNRAVHNPEDVKVDQVVRDARVLVDAIHGLRR